MEIRTKSTISFKKSENSVWSVRFTDKFTYNEAVRLYASSRQFSINVPFTLIVTHDVSLPSCNSESVTLLFSIKRDFYGPAFSILYPDTPSLVTSIYIGTSNIRDNVLDHSLRECFMADVVRFKNRDSAYKLSLNIPSEVDVSSISGLPKDCQTVSLSDILLINTSLQKFSKNGSVLTVFFGLQNAVSDTAFNLVLKYDTLTNNYSIYHQDSSRISRKSSHSSSYRCVSSITLNSNPDTPDGTLDRSLVVVECVFNKIKNLLNEQVTELPNVKKVKAFHIETDICEYDRI